VVYEPLYAMKKLFEGKIRMGGRVVPVHVDWHFPQEIPSLFLTVEPGLYEVHDYIYYKGGPSDGYRTKAVFRPVPHTTHIEGWGRSPSERDALYSAVVDLLFKAQRCHYIHCSKLNLKDMSCSDLGGAQCRAEDLSFNPVEGKCPYALRTGDGAPVYEDVLTAHNISRVFQQTSPNMDVIPDRKPPIYIFRSKVTMTYYDERPYRVAMIEDWVHDDNVE